MRHVGTLVVGQGIAGSAAAWTLLNGGEDVLVVDRGGPDTSSRVAAGLVTPVTGKHLARAKDYDALFAAAADFYRTVEAATGAALWTEAPSVRLLEGDALAAFFARPDMPGVRPWRGSLQDGGAEARGFEMTPAARLDVSAYLDATRRHLANVGRLIEADLDPSDVLHDPHAVRAASLGVTADRVVFCCGPVPTPPFDAVPDDPARGDVLRVRIPDYRPRHVAHFGHWIVPEAGGTQLVGATFDWKQPSAEAAADGRGRLLRSLEAVVRGPFEVLEVRSAVRPTMRDHRPVVGRHPDRPRAFVLGGLGAKGVLRAPTMAGRLLASIRGEEPPRPFRYDRLVTPRECPRPLTAVAHEAVREALRPGETAVDATVGNGFDTVFLAETVGPAGRVVGFDVQAAAVEGTRRRLAAAGLAHVELRHESHAAIAGRVAGPIAAAMFNLGYLPRGDRAVVTRPESTLAALRAALALLRPGGVATVLCYRGHDGGPEEAAAVRELLAALPEEFEARTVESTPPSETSPVLHVVRRGADHFDARGEP